MPYAESSAKTASVISAVPTSTSGGDVRHRRRRQRSARQVGGAQPALEHRIDGGLYARRLVGAVEAMSQKHRDREEGGQRIGYPFAGDVGGGAVDRLEEAGRARGAETGRRQHPQRAGEHRRLVAEDVAEEVLGDDHVEVGGTGDELHRGVVDQQVVERDVGVLRRDPAHHLAPEP